MNLKYKQTKDLERELEQEIEYCLSAVNACKSSEIRYLVLAEKVRKELPAWESRLQTKLNELKIIKIEVEKIEKSNIGNKIAERKNNKKEKLLAEMAELQKRIASL
jgi:hypothetical protein